MKKTVLTYGLIAGVFSAFWMLLAVTDITKFAMETGIIFGFATMILGHLLIFVAIKRFRDKQNNGLISFGKAFLIGFYISLIASSIYVFTWLYEYQFHYPNYIEDYQAGVIKKMQDAHEPAAKIAEQTKEMQEFGEKYKGSFFFRMIVSYAEILPVGIIMSLIAALIFRKKLSLNKSQDMPN